MDQRAEPPGGPASGLKDQLCALLGIIDHDDDEDSSARIAPTGTRIVAAVDELQLRLTVLTGTDPATVDLRAALDDLLTIGHRIPAIVLIRERLGCGLPTALTILLDRFRVLSQLSPESFEVDIETFWDGVHT